jgi:hypothetical protein
VYRLPSPAKIEFATSTTEATAAHGIESGGPGSSRLASDPCSSSMPVRAAAAPLCASQLVRRSFSYSHTAGIQYRQPGWPKEPRTSRPGYEIVKQVEQEGRAAGHPSPAPPSRSSPLVHRTTIDPQPGGQQGLGFRG